MRCLEKPKRDTGDNAWPEAPRPDILSGSTLRPTTAQAPAHRGPYIENIRFRS
jgi:hypothetical protein